MKNVFLFTVVLISVIALSFVIAASSFEKYEDEFEFDGNHTDPDSSFMFYDDMCEKYECLEFDENGVEFDFRGNIKSKQNGSLEFRQTF